jgi:hypothetical protein
MRQHWTKPSVIRVPSRLNCWGIGAFVALLAMLLNGAVRVQLYGGSLQAFAGFGLAVMCLHGVCLGLAAGLFRWQVRQRRCLLLYRFQVIADCNHHIRNALQAIVCTTASCSCPPDEAAQVQEDVERIERVLREVLPQTVADKLPEGSKAARLRQPAARSDRRPVYPTAIRPE